MCCAVVWCRQKCRQQSKSNWVEIQLKILDMLFIDPRACVCARMQPYLYHIWWDREDDRVAKQYSHALVRCSWHISVCWQNLQINTNTTACSCAMCCMHTHSDMLYLCMALQIRDNSNSFYWMNHYASEWSTACI